MKTEEEMRKEYENKIYDFSKSREEIKQIRLETVKTEFKDIIKVMKRYKSDRFQNQITILTTRVEKKKVVDLVKELLELKSDLQFSVRTTLIWNGDLNKYKLSIDLLRVSVYTLR